MTMGWFFLTGREMSAPMVAAILTIIGFSINDTVVIFDRIREDLKLGVRGSFRELMNHAINQVLSARSSRPARFSSPLSRSIFSAVA